MKTNTKQFSKLQAEWYKKLKDSGFEDAEDSEGMLKQWHSTAFKPSNNRNEINTEALQEYYRKAGHFLHEHKFDNESDRLTWELHANGTAIRDIVLELKAKGFKAYKRIVHEKIQALVIEMKKSWNL